MMLPIKGHHESPRGIVMPGWVKVAMAYSKNAINRSMQVSWPNSAARKTEAMTIDDMTLTTRVLIMASKKKGITEPTKA